MYIFLSILLILAAILLILVVLLQPGKGGGLAGGTFGGGVTGQFNTMFGARRTADFLQKFTIGLAIGIIVVSLLTNKFFLDTPAAAVGAGRAPVTTGAPLPSAPPAQAPGVQQQPAQQQPAQQQPAQQQPQQGQ
jgi:preprotein translocase subunit SecG